MKHLFPYAHIKNELGVENPASQLALVKSFSLAPIEPATPLLVSKRITSTQPIYERVVEPFYKQTIVRGRDYNLNGDGARPVHGFGVSDIKAPSLGSNQVVGSFINDTGINLGAFVATHYWMVPEIQKESFCKKMTGFNIDCLTYGHFPHHNPNENLAMLIAETKISGDDMLNQEVAQFQDGFSNLSSSSMWERMGLSGNKELEYKSTIILFYSIIKNTTVTSKVNGPWSIKQVSFNPTDFCRYAHERSDLSTH